jgi:hypothetical protein
MSEEHSLPGEQKRGTSQESKSKQASRTYRLESIEGRNKLGQQKKVSEGHSLARDHKGRDKLREKKKANEQMRGTHFLESTKGGTS